MAKDLVTHDDDLGIDFSDLMMVFMMIAMASLAGAVGSITNTAARGLQAQSYTGLTDTRVLHATTQLQWLNLVSSPPYAPWVTASFHNDGPSTVLVAVNNPSELHELEVGEGLDVDMIGADRRIELVFYRAYPGAAAAVRTIGKY